MQSYTEISENTSLKNSREQLLNNDKTALSNSAGTSFPTKNVQIGQLCFRTDVPGLYQYVAANTWKKLFGIVNGNVVFENVPTYVAATSSALGLVKIGSNITNSSGTISITKSNVTSALGYTPPTQDTTYGAASSNTLGLVKIGSNITNSSGTISLTKANVTAALGYTPPTTNTTYGPVTASKNGLMTPAMLALLGTGGGIIAASLGTNGYVKFANGFILQWGIGTTISSHTTKTAFQISYSQACYGVYITARRPNGTVSSDSYNASNGVKYYDNSGFYGGLNTSGTDNFFWMSVGY
jgi:hypothetical protein